LRLNFLDSLYARPGPYASVYVDTSRDIDDPDKAIELRRRHARSDLIELGTDPATAGASADAVGTDADLPGRHGQNLLEPQLAGLYRDRLSAHDRDRLESFAAQRVRHPA
jgi:hypothetical protein